MDFAGQVAWVTGGSSGIGRALAVELARRGADVAVSARREDRLADTVAAIEATGRRGLAVPCDVTDEAAVQAAARSITETLGRLDVAVANAGYGVGGTVAETAVGHWQRQLDVNVLGVVRTLQAALPALRETRGRLVIVGSASAFAWVPRVGPYQVSKAALRPLAHTLAAELHGTGVTVTLIHPGFVASEIAQVDNDGVHHPDRRDKRPHRLMWPTDRAARRMADIIRRRPLERTFTWHGWLAALLGQHAAWVVNRIVRRSGAPARADTAAADPG